MRSNNFTFDFLAQKLKDWRLERHHNRTYLPTNPYDDIIIDLQRLNIIEQVNGCQTFEDLINVLKNVNYIYINNQFIPTNQVIDLIDDSISIAKEAIMFKKIQITLEKLPSEYGIKSKAYELVLKLF